MKNSIFSKILEEQEKFAIYNILGTKSSIDILKILQNKKTNLSKEQEQHAIRGILKFGSTENIFYIIKDPNIILSDEQKESAIEKILKSNSEIYKNELKYYLYKKQSNNKI